MIEKEVRQWSHVVTRSGIVFLVEEVREDGYLVSDGPFKLLVEKDGHCAKTAGEGLPYDTEFFSCDDPNYVAVFDHLVSTVVSMEKYMMGVHDERKSLVGKLSKEALVKRFGEEDGNRFFSFLEGVWPLNEWRERYGD